MFTINENYLNLKESYLFSTIAKKVSQYKTENPDADIIRLGIGDVTLPLPSSVVEALHKSVDEMSKIESFRGYGPERGYDFLLQRISEVDYKQRGIDIGEDEIFVSDGSKSDTGNIVDILGENNIVGIIDPVYPVYLDTNLMRLENSNKIVLLPRNEANGFIPEIPTERVDVIYLCSPDNPTGIAMTKTQLKQWIDYALENKSLILFDSAYRDFITEKGIPRSIYEIEGANYCAIEFNSFSKNAAFTGLRCSYTVVPNSLVAKVGEIEVSLNRLWNRRQSTKFNGAPYIVQRGAEAVYTEKGEKETKAIIDYYMRNANLIREAIRSKNWTVFGGVNSPYIWLKCPSELDSWTFFDRLLNECNIVGTPGVGFGKSGEGYFRLTAFNTYDRTLEALERIRNHNF